MKAVRYSVIALMAVAMLVVGLADVSTAGEKSPAMGPDRVGQNYSALEKSNCPMLLSRAEVSVKMTDDGVALEYASNKINRNEMKRRVAFLAEQFQLSIKDGTAEKVGLPISGVKAQSAWRDGKERLVFTPKSSNETVTLHNMIEVYAMAMNNGQCPILRELFEQKAG
jgi:hypothetical protein